jgi:hypothetical protein
MSGTARPAEAIHFYRYACAESSMGRILVLMTDEGVVDVFRGDSRKELLRAALAHHPGAGLIPDRGAHLQWVAAVVKNIELPWLQSEVPIEDDAGIGRRVSR